VPGSFPDGASKESRKGAIGGAIQTLFAWRVADTGN
jgi:hypothetical protein